MPAQPLPPPVNDAMSFQSKIKIVPPKSRKNSPSAASTTVHSSLKKIPGLHQQKAEDVLRDLEKHWDTDVADRESFSILAEANSISEIKLEFELPEMPVSPSISEPRLKLS